MRRLYYVVLLCMILSHVEYLAGYIEVNEMEILIKHLVHLLMKRIMVKLEIHSRAWKHEFGRN